MQPFGHSIRCTLARPEDVLVCLDISYFNDPRTGREQGPDGILFRRHGRRIRISGAEIYRVIKSPTPEYCGAHYAQYKCISHRAE